MKKKSSLSISARAGLRTFLVLSSVALLCLISPVNTHAQTQTSGTINPDGTGTNLTFMGNHVSPGGNIMESTCVDPATAGPAASCEVYLLTVNGTPADWAAAGKKIQVLLTWINGSNEYDIYVHQGSDVNGPLVTSAVQGPGQMNQVVIIDPSSAGTGQFTIHIAYDTTPTAATDPYTANVTAVVGCGGTGHSPPAPQDPNVPNNGIGYENYEAPGVLTPVIVTNSGGATVEYLGRGAGEPSDGVNWLSADPNTAVGGVVNIQSDLETDFVYFANLDTTASTLPAATWLNRRSPTSVAIDSDPIAWTDRETGRVFSGELTLLSPDTPKISYSDNDGLSWTPAPFLQGPASAVDHETIGGGHYNPNSVPPPPPSPTYPNAVYYCSQDIATAFCARSDDGGVTLGTQVPLYTLEQCGGLHGHVKVAPDGTVYVPNRSCLGGNTSVVVSTDNGVTWTVRPITNATLPASPSTDDPAVGLDSDGTVYALFALNGTQATVAVSHDQGQTWTNVYDVGAAFGVNNVAFPAAVGGSSGRAAVAFYGSTNPGCDSSADQFSGIWHLYIAHTFDGGAHWTTTDTTPALPMQRMGLLRGGGGPADRNLLDFFDISVDKDGRAIVGYVNGCSGGPCSQAASSATGNAYTATASLMRQSSGKRLFAANDPSGSTSRPGMPFVTASRIGNIVQLAWNEADSGNQTITGYDIWRSTSSNNETLLTSVGNVTSYMDNTATDATHTYYYQVVAKNATGNSPRRNEISVPFVGDTCSGVIIHRNLPNHPEAIGGAAGANPLPQYLIDYIAVGEPPNTTQLMFQLKVGNLTTLPPNSRWRIVWNWVGTAANPNAKEQYFVGMTTDQNGTPSFEYGTVSTLSLVVLGVPTENPVGTPDSANYNPDGTITIFIDKSKVGSPRPGDLLGAINGRTFNTGDTPPQTLERSTLIVDHTFVKGNTDNSYPAATYAVVGNTICSSGNIEPVSAVSRMTHGTAGTFDVDLPLTGKPGIECRYRPAAPQTYTAVITFSTPVTVSDVMVTPGAGGTASIAPTNGFAVNNSQVTVNLANVSNAQTLTISLLGVTGGARTGDVAIPMSVLIGDVDGSARTDSTDVTIVRSQTVQTPTQQTCRYDVNTSGRIDATDVTVTRTQTVTGLPPQ